MVNFLSQYTKMARARCRLTGSLDSEHQYDINGMKDRDFSKHRIETHSLTNRRKNRPDYSGLKEFWWAIRWIVSEECMPGTFVEAY